MYRDTQSVVTLNAVDLWDYLLCMMEGEVLGCRVVEGGLGAHVVWSLGMTLSGNLLTPTRCSDPVPVNTCTC